jgi:hypothetical protein
MLKSFLLAAAAAALVTAGPAAAVDRWLFGYSPAGSQTLLSDGGTSETNNHGWFNNFGIHDASNSNYFVGGFSGGLELRNFFIFDVTGFGAVSDAQLEIGNPGGEGSGGGLNLNGVSSVTWTLYDFGTFVDTNQGYTGATGIFADLGTGTSYGSVTVSGATTLVTVSLNAAGIAAINQAIATDGLFKVGGRLTPLAVIPEPGTWALLIAGFGMVGAAVRRRRAAIA